MNYYSLLTLSVLLYVISLFVLCLSTGSEGLFTAQLKGWEVLQVGAVGVYSMQFAWISNPLYFGSLILSFIRISRITLTLSILASLLALNTFTWKYDIYYGAYIWMVSIFTLTALQFFYFKRPNLK